MIPLNKGAILSDITSDTPAPRRDLKWVFIGPDGLRAGWSVLAFLATSMLIIVALFTLLVVTLHLLHPNGHPPARSATMKNWQTAIGEVIFLVGFLGATALLARIQRRPMASLGFSPRGGAARFAQGAAVGFGLMAVMVGVLWALHAVAFDGWALNGPAAILSGLAWAGVFLLVGASEEVAMRGYLLQTLARGLNFRWAMVISSALFMALHIPNTGEGPFGLSQVFVIGVVFSLSIWKTGTLWWAIGYHAAWDWTQSFVFGVHDSGQPIEGALLKSHPLGPIWLSGGDTGPEGSVLTAVAVAVTAAIIIWGLKRRDQDLPVRW